MDRNRTRGFGTIHRRCVGFWVALLVGRGPPREGKVTEPKAGAPFWASARDSEISSQEGVAWARPKSSWPGDLCNDTGPHAYESPTFWFNAVLSPPWNFWARDPTFLFCMKFRKFCSWSWTYNINKDTDRNWSYRHGFIHSFHKHVLSTR